MAGALSQGWDALVKKGLKVFIEQIWPIVKYLVDRSIFITIVGMAAIAAGVWYKLVSGDTGAWCIVIIVGLVLASRILGKKKGEPK